MTGHGMTTQKMPRPSKKQRTAMTAPEMERKIEQLEFAMKSRGRRMGALYSVITKLMSDNPHVYHVEPAQDDMVESLKRQLTQARALVAAAMAASPAAPPAENKGFDCVVCYEVFNQDVHQPVALSCGHVLCEQCCLTHQSGKDVAQCPTCRKPFVSFLPLFM
jgi:hypothetical protein